MKSQKNTGGNNQILAEVWEDIVDVKDMIYSLIICTIGTLGGYIVAPNTPPKPLLFGLTGGFIGFLVCAMVFKPKREFYEEEEE
ncbi:MAG: hypothetical protein HPY70_10505 [Firmicutes bacterium]|jgi:uncharacterized membrane protein YfcA|nr:hypothetical protein [Bacillota bacterium]